MKRLEQMKRKEMCGRNQNFQLRILGDSFGSFVIQRLCRFGIQGLSWQDRMVDINAEIISNTKESKATVSISKDMTKVFNYWNFLDSIS